MIRKTVFLIIILLSIPLFARADDAQLYALIRGKSFVMEYSGTVYTLAFIGSDAEAMEGLVKLSWPSFVEKNGYRYPIEEKLVMVFFVWNDTIGIDVSADGSVSTFDFTVDYAGGLRQVCPDLHFFPVAER